MPRGALSAVVPTPSSFVIGAQRLYPFHLGRQHIPEGWMFYTLYDSFRDSKAKLNKGCCWCLEKSQVVDLWMHWLTWSHLTGMTHSRVICQMFLVFRTLQHDVFFPPSSLWICFLTSVGPCALVVTLSALWHHCLGSHRCPLDLLWLGFCFCSSIFGVNCLSMEMLHRLQ